MTSLATRTDVPSTPGTFSQWMQHGQALYDAAVQEYQVIEKQMADLQQRLAEKQSEINRLAGIIGKPALPSARHHRGSADDSPASSHVDRPMTSVIGSPPRSLTAARSTRQPNVGVDVI